jgi:hypothetical protein
LDYQASQCIATFGGQQIGTLSRVTELRQQSGRDGSYALVLIPLDVLDRIVPTLCGLTSSPISAIKHLGQLVQCKAVILNGDGSTAQVTLLNGRVIDINQEIFKDQVIVRCIDDRHLMEGVRLPGSFWLSGDAGGNGQPAWRPGIPLHCNPGGRPNRIYVPGPFGPVPVQCQPFFGLKDAEEPTNPTAQSQASASYWTPTDLMIYLRYATSAPAVSAYLEQLPWISTSTGSLPNSIIWPAGLESTLANSTGGSTRKVREMTLEGNLLDALCQVVEAAGPLAIWLSPNEDGTSNLAIVATKYSPSGDGGAGSAGVSVPRAAGGSASQTLTTPGTIVSGAIRENSQNLYTRVVVAGSNAPIETRLTAGAQTSTANPPVDNSPLIARWASSGPLGLEAFKAEILRQMNATATSATPLDTAIKNCMRQFWPVLRSWVVNPSYNFYIGTDYSGAPLCITTRIPKPHLDSSYVNNDSQLSSSALAALNSKREIPLEVDSTYYPGNTTPDDNNFHVLPIANGVQIEPDGTIDLSALAEQFINGLNSFGLFNIQPHQDPTSGVWDFDDPATFKIGRIRIDLSIPTDYRVYGACKLANDPTNTPVFQTLVDDSDRIDFTQSRLAYVNALGLLQKEQRYNSWPVPQSAPPAVKAPDGYIRNDTDEAINQSYRKLNDLGRLDRTSIMVSNKIALSYIPGTMIASINNVGVGGTYPMKQCLRAVEYNFESRPQKMTYFSI